MKTGLVYFALLATLSGTSMFLWAQEKASIDTEKTTMENRIEKIMTLASSGNVDLFTAEYSRCSQSVRTAIRSACDQIKLNSLSAEAKGMLIFLLGKWRAEEAIPVLIENFNFSMPSNVQERRKEPLIYHSPAQTSLYEIGVPAVLPLWRSSLEMTEVEAIHQRLVIIRAIYDWDVFGLFAEAMVAKVEDKAQAERMRFVITKIMANRPE